MHLGFRILYKLKYWVGIRLIERNLACCGSRAPEAPSSPGSTPGNLWLLFLIGLRSNSDCNCRLCLSNGFAMLQKAVFNPGFGRWKRFSPSVFFSAAETDAQKVLSLLATVNDFGNRFSVSLSFLAAETDFH